jgi:hypothetical protein
MSTNLKYIIYALLVLVAGTIAVIIYRLFFQFNSDSVHVYAREEAAKYKDSPTVYALILEGTTHILASHTLSQQVLTTANKTNTDKEQVLVMAAIAQCQAYGYLK